MSMQVSRGFQQPLACCGGAWRQGADRARLVDHIGGSAVRTGRIQIDDVVEVRVHGRMIVGRVTSLDSGIVHFEPISPGAGWGHAKAREIVAHWRKQAGERPNQTPRLPTSSNSTTPGEKGPSSRSGERPGRQPYFCISGIRE